MPRKHDRTSISLDVTLEFTSGTRSARVSDLSIGGCFVDTIVPVNVGEFVRIRIRLSDDQWEQMIGEVAYILPSFGFGLNFKGISEEQKWRISDVIVANGGTV